MDVDNVHSGMEYEVLKESYVIFLCLGDAIGKDLPVYTFRYRADEDKSILMNDGTVNVFFNVRMYDKMKSPKLRAFCEYLCGQESDTAFTGKLSALVARLKLNAQRRHEYMTWEQELKIQARYLAQEIAPEMAKGMAQELAKDMANDIAKDMAKGAKAEGQTEKAIETAKNMLDNDISTELVAKCTGMPLEQVLQLQKEVMSPAAK